MESVNNTTMKTDTPTAQPEITPAHAWNAALSLAKYMCDDQAIELLKQGRRKEALAVLHCSQLIAGVPDDLSPMDSFDELALTMFEEGADRDGPERVEL